MATQTNSQDLTNLVINKVASSEVFDEMVSNGLINANELYLVEGDDSVTYALSGALSGNTFVSTLTPSEGSATTATTPAMGAASANAAGTAGLVPAPSQGSQNKFLRGDATWAEIDPGDSLPSQSGNNGKFLTTDGTDASWATIVQDDHKWGGVTLGSTGANTAADAYVPSMSSMSNTTGTASWATVTSTPGAYKIAKYDVNSQLKSTTPAAGDNTTKVATTAFVKTAISALGSVFNYKGTKSSQSALPSTDNKAGDVWSVGNSEFVWTGSAWEELGTAVDLSGYVPTSRTVNGKALSTDISLTASDVGALPDSYTAPVTSVNGQTGDVTITDSDEKLKTELSSITTDLGVLLGATNNTTSTKYYDLGITYRNRSDENTARLTIGISGTGSTRRQGQIVLYNQDKYCILRNTSTSNSGYYINLPSQGGTLALKSDIPSGSSTTPAMDGTAAAGTESAWARGDHVHPTDTSRASSDHTHGNITNAGALQTNDITIANGDKIVVTDASDSDKVARTSIAFDGSTTTQFLSKKGTWVTPSDTKVTQTPLNGANSTRGMIVSSGTGASETTNTVSTTNKFMYSDYSTPTVYLYNSDRTKYSTWHYDYIRLANAGSTYTGSISTTTVTENRNYIFPDKNGTVALTSDIPSVPSGSSTSPKMDGTATVGTETAWAHGDHIHPTDTSRQAKITASGILKGDGNGGVSAATAGTDYQAPLTAGTDYQTPLVAGTDYTPAKLGTASRAVVTDANKNVTVADLSVSSATAETDTATTFVYSVTQNSQGKITVKTRPLPTYNNYSLPLAASGTRGGIQIGYSESGNNYAVKLSSEKAYVTVPWTDTSVTAVGNHYTPTADANAELTGTLSGTAGAYAINTEYTVLTGVKAQRDAAGHVVGITYTAQKIKDTNNTYTVGNKALKIAGDSGTATQAITVNESSSDRTFTISGDSYIGTTAGGSSNAATLSIAHKDPVADNASALSATASGATAAWSIDVVKAVQIQRDAKGHVTGVTVTSGKIPANPNTDTKVTQNNSTTNANYRLLLSYGATNDAQTNTVNKSGNLLYNPSTNLLSTGNLNLTGNLDVVGTAHLHDSTTIDSLTAGSLLVNGATSFVQIPTAPTAAEGTNDTQLATTAFVKNSIASLSTAMHFIGKATVAITDGSTTDPTITGYDFAADRKPGDVIIDNSNAYEYVWTYEGKWERLGPDGSYKVTQSAVDTGAAATNKWVSRIQQNANGVITATMASLDTSGTWSGNAATATNVAWSGVTGKPSTYPPSTHTHPQDNNFIAHDNEFNFVSTLTENFVVHVNHRQTGGNNTDGYKITKYMMKDGAGALTAVEASSFIGSGASLTSLNASNISSGTLAAARLPSVTRTNNTSTASPAHSGTFTTIDSITTDTYGRVTAVNTKTITLPSDNNTDTKVTQSVTTTANWRKVLLHYTDQAASTTAVVSQTQQVYAAVGVSVQPSTGAIRATKYNVADGVELQYDSTLAVLNFVFA